MTLRWFVDDVGIILSCNMRSDFLIDMSYEATLRWHVVDKSTMSYEVVLSWNVCVSA